MSRAIVVPARRRDQRGRDHAHFKFRCKQKAREFTEAAQGFIRRRSGLL